MRRSAPLLSSLPLLLLLALPAVAVDSITSFTPMLTADKTQGTSGGVSGAAPMIVRLSVRGSTCTDDYAGDAKPCGSTVQGSQTTPHWIVHENGVSVVWVLSGAGCYAGPWPHAPDKSALILRGSFVEVYVANPGLCHVDAHFIDTRSSTGPQFWLAQADFHAADPDVTFSGANTVCIHDDVGSPPTCPGGGTNTAQADLNLGSALATHMGAGKRVLAESGVAWTKSATETIDASSMQLGPYGGASFALTDTGSNHPYFDCSGTPTGVTIWGLDAGFSAPGSGNDDQELWNDNGCEAEDILFAHVELTNTNASRTVSNLWFNDFRAFAAADRQLTQRLTFADVTAHHLFGKNGVFAACEQCGFIGTSVRNTTRGTGSSGGSEHTVRLPDHHFVYAAFSYLGDINDTRSAFTPRVICREPLDCNQMDGQGASPDCDTAPTQEYCDAVHIGGPLNIHDSIVTQCVDGGGAAGTRICQSCGAGCGGGTGTVNNTECSTAEIAANLFGFNPTTALGNVATCDAQKIGIQNDGYEFILMDSNGCANNGNADNGSRCYTEGASPTRVVSVNNAARHEEVAATGQFNVAAGTYGQNNVAWASHDVSLLCDESTTAVNALCLENTTNPYLNAAESDPPAPADFQIGAGSVAAGAGSVSRSVLDIDQQWRDWDGGVYDQGASAFNTSSAPAIGGGSGDAFSTTGEWSVSGGLEIQ